MLPRYGSDQAPLAPLLGRRIAVFGYGNQGRAQALNLRDSGLDVTVAVRPGASADRAAADGLRTSSLEDGAAAAELAALLVPDEAAPGLVNSLHSRWRAGVVFVLAHGYNVTYGRLHPPPGARVACVAPAGPGLEVRSRFESGGGVTAFLSLSDPADPGLKALALAYAAGIGCAHAGIYECSFREETEVDLFGEQAVLCGGLSALVSQAFATLVSAGYPAEMAYLECVRQVSLTGSLIHAGGLEGMRDRISPTALYGELTRGPRLREAGMAGVMETMLAEIRDGRFAAEWDRVSARGPAALRELRAKATDARLEATRRARAGDDPGG